MPNQNQKRHYEDVARILREARAYLGCDPAAVDTLDHLASKFGYLFEHDNPLFEAPRFYRA